MTTIVVTFSKRCPETIIYRKVTTTDNAGAVTVTEDPFASFYDEQAAAIYFASLTTATEEN